MCWDYVEETALRFVKTFLGETVTLDELMLLTCDLQVAYRVVRKHARRIGVRKYILTI